MTKTAVTPEQFAQAPAMYGGPMTNGHSLNHGASAPASLSRVVVVAREESLRSAMCEDVHAAGFVSLAFEHAHAVRFGPADRVHCAVLALNGHDAPGKADAVRSLLQSEPHLPVVVVSDSDGTDAVLAAMRAGARDYLTHPVRPGELADSIRGQITRAHRERTPQSLPPGFAQLSRCECEVLDGVIRGCSTKAIAAEVGRVEKTIEYHRKRIMEKLGVSTAVQMVRLATLHGWTWDGRGEDGGSNGSARSRGETGGR